MLHHRVCPWWIGYLLVSPLRRFLYDPEEIVRPHIRAGMNILDIGCGMGFFSLAIAKLVGDTGKVVCVDLQSRMIEGLIRRSKKAGLSHIIDTRLCRKDSLGVDDLAEKMDFALAFALAHEVPDKERLLAEICHTLKQTGRLLIAEPRAHVSREDFDKTISLAERAGFQVLDNLAIRRSYATLLGKRPDKRIGPHNGII